jgi:hypothetical protein
MQGYGGRYRCGWVDNIKIYLRVVCGIIWTGLIWLRIGNSCGCCEKANELLGSINM